MIHPLGLLLRVVCDEEYFETDLVPVALLINRTGELRT